MGFWKRIREAITGLEERASPENPNTPLSGATLEDMFGAVGAETKAGARVGIVTSLKQTTVWACVRALSETVATLPLQVFERDSEQRRVARDHALYTVLHDSPNEQMTSFVFRETLMAHCLLWGNAYALIVGDDDGRRLLLVQPNLVRTKITTQGLRYFIRYDESTEVEYQPAEVIHIPGLTLDGIVGLSPVIESAREAIGLALAAEEHASRYFSNGARLSGILSTDGVLGEDVVDRVRKQWQANQGGLVNAYKTAVLEQGLKFQAISQTADQAQLKEIRQQQVEEIARAFRVPPMFVGDYSRMTYSNSEQNDLHFAKHTIAPWLQKIEQELNRKLFAGTDFFCEFNLDGLLRGDFKTRIDGFARGIQGGIYTPNEVRRMLNLPSMEGGDTLFIQQNMASATAIVDQPEEPTDESGTPGVRS